MKSIHKLLATFETLSRLFLRGGGGGGFPVVQGVDVFGDECILEVEVNSHLLTY